MSLVEPLEGRIEQLEAQLEAAQSRLRDVATMGAVVTSIQEIDAVLSVVMDMAIRQVDGEVGLIMLEELGDLRLKTAWGLDETFARSLGYRDEPDLPTHVYQSRQPVILNDLRMTNEDGLRIDSIICLPIQTSKACLGILLIVNKAGGASFGEQDRDLLEILTNFAAVAIDNSRLFKARLLAQQAQQELALARQVQKTILPQKLQVIPGLEIGAAYFPMGEVGGDFYDLIRLENDQGLVVLGDVSSHGVPAALVMSATAGIIRASIRSQPNLPIERLATHINDFLAEEIIKDEDMFVTLFLCKVNLKEERLTYCNAGHLPGLFWDNKKAKVEPLSAGGPIMGQFPGVEFRVGSRSLRRHDRLFLFTDGLTEAADAQGNLLGRDRAEQVFTAEIDSAPQVFCGCLKEYVDRFAEGSPLETHDDFTVLQLRVS